MTELGDELLFSYEELTAEPNSRCVVNDYLFLSTTKFYDATEDMLSLGRRLNEPKECKIIGSHENITAARNDYVHATIDFVKTHDELRKSHDLAAASTAVTSSKYYAEFKDFVREV